METYIVTGMSMRVLDIQTFLTLLCPSFPPSFLTEEILTRGILSTNQQNHIDHTNYTSYDKPKKQESEDGANDHDIITPMCYTASALFTSFAIEFYYEEFLYLLIACFKSINNDITIKHTNQHDDETKQSEEEEHEGDGIANEESSVENPLLYIPWYVPSISSSTNKPSFKEWINGVMQCELTYTQAHPHNHSQNMKENKTKHHRTTEGESVDTIKYPNKYLYQGSSSLAKLDSDSFIFDNTCTGLPSNDFLSKPCISPSLLHIVWHTFHTSEQTSVLCPPLSVLHRILSQIHHREQKRISFSTLLIFLKQDDLWSSFFLTMHEGTEGENIHAQI